MATVVDRERDVGGRDNSGVARLVERPCASASKRSMPARSRPVSWPMPSTTISGV
jgi:hypothetical protein